MTITPTSQWFDRFPRPAIIAHRGASHYAPENTLAAFRLAEQQGADAIELDVDQCSGGDLVVIHDATVDRTTTETGEISQLSLEAIKELDAGSWFDAEYRGEKVPTLDEVLEAFGRLMYINVELKNYRHLFDNLAEKVALTIQRHGLEDKVFVSSFNPLNFRKFKRRLPEVPAGLLTFQGHAGARLLQLLGRLTPYDALHPHHSDVSPQLIERMHHAGMPVFAYTVNDPEEMRRLLEAGLDGLIADDPVLAREVAAPFIRA